MISWQVNALVDATPISVPARIGRIDIGRPCNGAFGDIHHRNHGFDVLGGVVQCRQRVRRFAGLTDKDRRTILSLSGGSR